MILGTTLQSPMWTVASAAMAPILRTRLPGPTLAPVEFMIVGGALIGPQRAGLDHPDDLEQMSVLGLGFLFLLAGCEDDAEMFLMRRAAWPSARGSPASPSP